MGELSSQTVQGAIIQWNDLPGENDLFCELKKKKRRSDKQLFNSSETRSRSTEINGKVTMTSCDLE